MEESQQEQQQCTMRHLSPVAAPAHQGRTFVSPTPSTPSMDSSEDDEEHEGEVSAVDEGVEQESEKDLPMGEFSDDPPSPPLG
ncbi:hypothetical protein DXG01_000536, partial [Tephrocybe rancida]